MYSYFSSHTKTKLKFNPDIGTDVALPTPNPVTQYLSTSPTDKDIITGRSNMLLSTASSASQPSASSILRSTPASNESQYKVPSVPLASPFSSEPVVEAGRSKPEMSTLNTIGGRDTRSTLDTRAISKGTKKFKGAGLLGHNPNRNYYRQVLNAI
jgi:hypothetical protein